MNLSTMNDQQIIEFIADNLEKNVCQMKLAQMI